MPGPNTDDLLTLAIAAAPLPSAPPEPHDGENAGLTQDTMFSVMLEPLQNF